jgi:sialic acid synthase SpsE
MTSVHDISVGSRTIGHGRPPYLIAEVAWGHEGRLELALELVHKARASGAHAIGLHITSLPDYMTRDYRSLDGQTLSNKGPVAAAPPTIYGFLEKANLSPDAMEKVFREARAQGLHVCVMCNDRPSFEWARKLRPEMYAVAAAAFVELDFVEAIAREGVATVLRTGGATLGEIEDVVNVFRRAENPNVVILHGIQLYPTKVEDLNLAQIPILKAMFGCHVGLADHIDGGAQEALSFPLMAIVCGAVVLEKHFTDDRALKREDFEAALGAAEFATFARLAERAHVAIGRSFFSELTPAEQRYRRVVRKKIVAAVPIRKGEVIEPCHLARKRADAGGDPAHLKLLLGKRAAADIPADGPVDLTNVA